MLFHHEVPLYFYAIFAITFLIPIKRHIIIFLIFLIRLNILCQKNHKNKVVIDVAFCWYLGTKFKYVFIFFKLFPSIFWQSFLRNLMRFQDAFLAYIFAYLTQNVLLILKFVLSLIQHDKGLSTVSVDLDKGMYLTREVGSLISGKIPGTSSVPNQNCAQKIPAMSHE